MIMAVRTGQKSWEKVIPAESIQKGRTEQTLSFPGYALNFEGPIGSLWRR